MGSSCCLKQQFCPSHPDQTISSICLHNQCLQPLCDVCVQNHRQKHIKLGSVPKIQSYTKLLQHLQARKQSKQKSMKQQKKIEKDNAVLSKPTATVIKQLTYDYFANMHHKGKLNIVDLLQEIQLTTAIQKDTYIKQKLYQFLKNNLTSNEEVVGKDYSHLY